MYPAARCPLCPLQKNVSLRSQCAHWLWQSVIPLRPPMPTAGHFLPTAAGSTQRTPPKPRFFGILPRLEYIPYGNPPTTRTDRSGSPPCFRIVSAPTHYKKTPLTPCNGCDPCPTKISVGLHPCVPPHTTPIAKNRGNPHPIISPKTNPLPSAVWRMGGGCLSKKTRRVRARVRNPLRVFRQSHPSTYCRFKNDRKYRVAVLAAGGAFTAAPSRRETGCDKGITRTCPS